MEYVLHILLHNVIPLMIMISLGAVLERAFKLDIKTLTKLNFYLFSPAIVFLMLYESDLSMAVLLQVLLFFCLFITGLMMIVELVIRFKKYDKGMRIAMRNSVIFYNGGNYGIPLNQLVFSFHPLAFSIQAIIFVLQSLIANTLGVYSVNSRRLHFYKSVLAVLKLPAIYVIPIALGMRTFQIPIPQSIYAPIEYIAQAFVATALITLGVQLGGMQWKFRFSDVILSNVLRLCVGPLLGFFIVLLLKLDGIMAQALILSCATPTALNTMLLAIEFDNEEEFASQAVFSSVLFSIFTVTIVIFFIQHYF